MGSPINNIGPMQIYRLINFAVLLWPMQGFRSTAYLADTGPSRKYQWEFIGRPIQIYLCFIQNGPSWAFTIQTTKWHMGFIDNYGHFRQHGLHILAMIARITSPIPGPSTLHRPWRKTFQAVA